MMSVLYFVDPLYLCDLILRFVFFFNATATTEIYTLSLHDALPIPRCEDLVVAADPVRARQEDLDRGADIRRSEEHTSELQSQFHLVCRLLLEKKKLRSPLLSPLSYIAINTLTFHYRSSALRATVSR